MVRGVPDAPAEQPGCRAESRGRRALGSLNHRLRQRRSPRDLGRWPEREPGNRRLVLGDNLEGPIRTPCSCGRPTRAGPRRWTDARFGARSNILQRQPQPGISGRARDFESQVAEVRTGHRLALEAGPVLRTVATIGVKGEKALAVHRGPGLLKGAARARRMNRQRRAHDGREDPPRRRDAAASSPASTRCGTAALVVRVSPAAPPCFHWRRRHAPFGRAHVTTRPAAAPPCVSISRLSLAMPIVPATTQAATPTVAAIRTHRFG